MSWCSPMEKIVLLLLLLLIRSSVGLQRKKFVIQPHPVQFNEEPHDWTVTEGASVSLTCNTTVVLVIGYIDEDTTPVPQIKWFHDDVMINSSGHFTINNHGIDTSILTIRNVTSLEQGEYYCVVNEWVKPSRYHGPDGHHGPSGLSPPSGDWWTKTRSKSGHITVVGANSTLTVNIKEHVVLSCMEPAALIPSSGVVWTKDGVEMSENVTEINGNLLVMEVSEDSSGHYQCIDRVESTTLLYYSLTVDTATSRYLQQQELLIEDVRIENHFITIRHDADIHGCIGSPVNQSVTLTCKADGYREISWYKNGGLLDLNNEEIMFNQTTGDLVIRREYACDLLGVYQCFASNEIDTVHVSTRVLPFGWANHPGKPELIDLKSRANRFELRARVRPPDYLAGLTVESISYDVFLADGGESETLYYVDTINASKASEGVLIQLRKDFINGLGMIENVYYLKVSMRLNDKSLSSTVALPGYSPYLQVTTICTFIGNPPPPVIMETCKYDNISNLVTHNISWYVESLVEGIPYKFHIGWLKIYGGCTYPNGTTAGKYFDGHMVFRSSYSWKLPKNSVCNVSIFYETFCGSASSYLTESCDERAALGTTGVMISEPVGNKNRPVMLVAPLAAVLVMIAIISIVLIYLCYRKCSRHKRSALKMLKNVEEINKLQASCPITVDQQSVDGLCTRSELYIEKVTRWMEYVSEEPLDDSDSVLEGCSLGTSEMLDQIVEGRAARNVDDIPNESHDEALSLISCRKCDIKKRLQSADSGMESEGNGPCIGPNLFQKYCQHNGIKDESILTNHDHFNKLENKTLDHVGLQSTSSSNLSGLPRLIVNNHDNIAERVDGYVGLEVVNESLCAENFANQLQVEVNQDYHLSKSTQKVNLLVDRGNLELTKEFDCVETEVVDQNQYLPKSTENFDYVGLEVVDQCLPKSTEKFDHVEVEIIDQNLCLPKSIENFDYVGLEVVDQDDQEQHLIKSTEKFECDKLEVVDQNHCLCKSTDNFDYVGLEVVDQDHYLPRPVETVNANRISDDYVGLEQVDKLNDIQNHCMPKSTDKFGDYVEEEVDQGHSMSRSSEKFGNYIGLEVACQDQCVYRSTETVVDCLTVEIVPGWTEKVEDTADQCHSTSRSTGKFVGQNCCYQSGHEGSLSSTSSHDDGALHYALQYNDNGYVMSPVLTGLYCS